MLHRVGRLVCALAVATFVAIGGAATAGAASTPTLTTASGHTLHAAPAVRSVLPPRVTFVSAFNLGICVGIQNQGTHVGQRAVGTQCIADHNDQIWHFVGDIFGQLVTEGTGMCLDTATSTNHGTGPNVVQWICDNTASSQLWYPFFNPDGSTSLLNAQSGQCLSLTSFSSGHNLMMDVCGLDPIAGDNSFEEFALLSR